MTTGRMTTLQVGFHYLAILQEVEVGFNLPGNSADGRGGI